MGRHGRYWPGGATSGRTLVGGPGGKFGGTFEDIYLNMIYDMCIYIHVIIYIYTYVYIYIYILYVFNFKDTVDGGNPAPVSRWFIPL